MPVDSGFSGTMESLPESVRDSHLETKIDQSVQGSFVHLIYNRGGRRTAPHQELWKVKRQLGRGTFGTVSLYETVRSEENALRAVKEIAYCHGESVHSYVEELEALAKFSKPKVTLCIYEY